MTDTAFTTGTDFATAEHGPQDGAAIDATAMASPGAASDPGILTSLSLQDVTLLTNEAGVHPASLSDVQIMEALFQMR